MAREACEPIKVGSSLDPDFIARHQLLGGIRATLDTLKSGKPFASDDAAKMLAFMLERYSPPNFVSRC